MSGCHSNIAKVLAAGGLTLALFSAMPGMAAENHEGLVRFENQWLEPAEAVQREEHRYRKQRVATPVEVSVELTADQLRAQRARRGLASGLMAFLRVGDRVLVQRGNQQWRIWKRHHKLTGEFRQAIDALRKGTPHTDEWAADPVATIKLETMSDDLLGDAAFALHAKRNAFPHADLAAGQLSAQGLVVKRNTEDGGLTVLAYGANNFKAETGKIAQVGRFAVVTVAPGNEPLSFTWATPPQRILAIGDNAIQLLPPAENIVLLKNEKRIIPLSEAKNVTSMRRYSQGPDYKGWQQQSFATGGPLGFQMDLRRDEAGPHQAAGDYQRIWILEIGGAEGKPATQRQTGMNYRVSIEDKDAQSKEFLRR